MNPLRLLELAKAHRLLRRYRRLLDTYSLSKPTQVSLMMHYRHLARLEEQLPALSEVEFRIFSQNGEDGILLYIFSLIGAQHRTAVEICAGDGVECNCANLVANHGWQALLFDGEKTLIDRGKTFYQMCPDTFRLGPTYAHAWVKVDNVNELIREHGFEGEVDLLSLDMDGVDFWIWKSLDCIQPRVVVLEYNNRWPASQSVTVAYDPAFATIPTPSAPGFFGASLAAFEKLGREKGYRLVGSNLVNTNAFFLREDVGKKWFPEVSVASCLSSPYAIHQHETKYPLIKHRDHELVQI